MVRVGVGWINAHNLGVGHASVDDTGMRGVHILLSMTSFIFDTAIKQYVSRACPSAIFLTEVAREVPGGTPDQVITTLASAPPMAMIGLVSRYLIDVSDGQIEYAIVGDGPEAQRL